MRGRRSFGFLVRNPSRTAPALGRQAQRQPDLVRDLLSHITLHGEDVSQRAIVRRGPELRLVPGIHELRADPDPVHRPPDAPFDDVVGAELPANFRNRLAAVAVASDRAPGHDAEGFRVCASELGDELVGKPVAQIVLATVATEVLEGQHRQHQPLGGIGAGANERFPGLRHLRGLKEPVTPPRKCLHVAGVDRVVTERHPDLADAVVDALLEVDEGPGSPELLLDVAASHDVSGLAHQEHEQLQGLRLQTDE